MGEKAVRWASKGSEMPEIQNVVREGSAAQSQGHTCSWQVPAGLMASWEAEGPACLAKARLGECRGLNEASTIGQL